MTEFRVKELGSSALLEAYKPEEIWGHCAHCGNHAGVWSCPPHSFDPIEFIKGFPFAYVLIGSVPLTSFTEMNEAVEHYYEERRRINRALLAFESTVPDSVGLFAGHCDACDECTRLQGLKCIRPDLCRYSLESLGLKVSDITQMHFDESLKWSSGSVPEKLLTVPALLSHGRIDAAELIQCLERRM